ncbi:hypothetical protein [Halovulum sp. GXIMD14793]
MDVFIFDLFLCLPIKGFLSGLAAGFKIFVGSEKPDKRHNNETTVKKVKSDVEETYNSLVF